MWVLSFTGDGSSTGMLDFHAAWRWCQQTFGQSDDIWLGQYVGATSSRWAWTIDTSDKRIYLATEQELTWFKLKFGAPDNS